MGGQIPRTGSQSFAAFLEVQDFQTGQRGKKTRIIIRRGRKEREKKERKGKKKGERKKQKRKTKRDKCVTDAWLETKKLKKKKRKGRRKKREEEGYVVEIAFTAHGRWIACR